MTHLMARGGPPGRRGPRRDARASGPRVDQGSQRTRRAAARHRRPGLLDRPLRCAPLTVHRTAARNAPDGRSSKPDQMSHYQRPLVLGEVAGRLPAFAQRSQRRRLLPAAGLGQGAAGGIGTAHPWPGGAAGVGLPRHQPGPAAARGIGLRHRGDQGPGVGMRRRGKNRLAGALLDDPAEVHHRDLAERRVDHRRSWLMKR